MAKYQFQTEVNQLLKLIIHSLYSNKDIFLREIVSNGSDALDKLKYLSVSDDNYKNIKFEPRIDITFDESNSILAVQDSGIGMNEEDLTTNLGTIARSGTKAFLEKLSSDAAKDSALIGQFGVGFYSAFMVSKKIKVESRSALSDKAYIWKSEGADGYTIKEGKFDTVGTVITLKLKDDTDLENYSEYLDSYRIKGIVKKYSDYIRYPIVMDMEKSKLKDGSENLGHSMILDYNGNILSEIDKIEGGIYAKINLEEMYEFRKKV